MKRFCFYFLFLIAALSCVACGSTPSIEGYWLSEFNESLAFSENGKMTANGIPATYSIFDENKLQIISDDLLQPFTFNGSFYIENDILYLTDLDTGTVSAYFGNEEIQTTIRQSIAEAEQEQLQLEEKRKEEDHAKQVEAVKSEISRNETEIQLLENQIQSCFTHIDDSKHDIALCYENISRHETDLQGDISEENKEYIRDLISYEYDDIAYYEEIIADYQNQITDLKTAKNAHENEIIKLKETLDQYNN